MPDRGTPVAVYNGVVPGYYLTLIGLLAEGTHIRLRFNNGDSESSFVRPSLAVFHASPLLRSPKNEDPACRSLAQENDVGPSNGSTMLGTNRIVPIEYLRTHALATGDGRRTLDLSLVGWHSEERTS